MSININICQHEANWFDCREIRRYFDKYLAVPLSQIGLFRSQQDAEVDALRGSHVIVMRNEINRIEFPGLIVTLMVIYILYLANICCAIQRRRRPSEKVMAGYLQSGNFDGMCRRVDLLLPRPRADDDFRGLRSSAASEMENVS